MINIDFKELEEALERVSTNVMVVGHRGIGKEFLSKAIIEKTESLDNINENKLDEFELMGIHLTEEQKLKLIGCGFTAQDLQFITTEEKLLENLAEEWNKQCIKEFKPIKKKTKRSEKKKFYE